VNESPQSTSAGGIIFSDFLVLFLPENGLTNDMALNVLYGAIIRGVGYGLVCRGQATSGGRSASFHCDRASK